MGNSLEARPFEALADKSAGASPYDLYLEGYSYGEIARDLQLNIFEVAEMIARETAIIADLRRNNPEQDLMFSIDMVRWAIRKARRDHGEIIAENDKGIKVYDGLSTVISGALALSKLNERLEQVKSERNDKDKPQLPAGIEPSDLRAVGREIIKQKFRNVSPLSVVKNAS